MQLRIFQNFGMKSCYTIGRMGKMDIHVCHMDKIVSVNDSKRLIFCAGACKFIQFFDNRHQLRDNGIQISTRPFFQCFCQNCVVGVGTGFCHNVDCFFKCNSFFFKKADELRDHHARMGIINLDCGIICQIMIITASCCTFCENQLGSGRNHQILLEDAKTPAGLIRIIRIEEKGQILGNFCFIKGNTLFDNCLIDGIQVEKVQRVCTTLVAGNCQFVQAGSISFSSQLNRVSNIGFFSPAVGGQPRIWFFVLKSVFERLMEQTKMIPQTYTVSRQI